MFFNFIWNCADSILFLKNRLKFYDINGIESKNSAGAPSCLVAYGRDNTRLLENSGIPGTIVKEFRTL